MEKDTITRLPELRRRVSSVVGKDIDEPVEIYFQDGVISPKYKITIEMIEDDYFIDAKGRKWLRAKDE
jgi:hypothetical protein